MRNIAFSYEERVAASYERKLREIFLAAILTRQRSKTDILNMYLNEVYYGNLAYGIEAAAQTYFGKPAADLTVGQAAFLAGLPQAPLELDPFRNFDAAVTRQQLVLDLMLEDGALDNISYQVARGEPLVLAPLVTPDEAAGSSVLQAPHFVLYVQRELEARYGPDAITRGGWQITTSLDMNLQRLAEAEARAWIAARAPVHDVDNAAVVALKPATGEILTMVGSLDYFDSSIDGQVNVALMPRQPGSSIKPITYAAAMEKGWTTGDVIWDVPILLDLGGGAMMRPVNYDNRYHGPVLLRDALANSYNIPPIQLIRDIGIDAMIATARRMGVQSLQEQPGYYGLALTLGGGEVPLLELTQAYATLANGGRRPQLTGVLRIEDGRGRVVFDQARGAVPAVNAVSPQIAYILTDILDDDAARVPAMGRGNALELPFPAAAKTGTTNDFRDNWTLGYTPGVVVGVWVGNTDGHPMVDSSGLRGAAPLWQRLMLAIDQDPLLQRSLLINGAAPPRAFARPAGVEEWDVCLPRATGSAACTATRPDLQVVGGAATGVSRLGYVPDRLSVPGAWRVTVLPLPASAAAAMGLSALADGTRPPLPTSCVVNMAVPPAGAVERLLLPVPPYYPDEVRARLWAQSTGYAMAPPAACPAAVVRGAQGGGVATGDGGDGGSEATGGNSGDGGVSAAATWRITAPTPGTLLTGATPIVGTASFDPARVAYYKLEIGSGANPTSWTTFGSTHSAPVVDGVLETLQADALPAGDYVIRLVVVENSGNFPPPFTVRVRIGSP